MEPCNVSCRAETVDTQIIWIVWQGSEHDGIPPVGVPMEPAGPLHCQVRDVHYKFAGYK